MPPPPPLRNQAANANSNRIGAPSLLQCATKLLINKVKEIDDVGALDIRLVRPIILKIVDPRKLRSIEQNSPQVAGEFADLWKKFIRRDFGADPDKYVPANPKLWYKVYAKHAKEAAERDKTSGEFLASKFDALKSKKSQHAPVLIKNPHAQAWSRVGVARPRGIGYHEDRDNWDTAAGSRTKDVFKKIKREVQASKTKLTVPTHMLKPRSRISQEVVTKLKASVTPITDAHPPAGLKRSADSSYGGSPEKKSRTDVSNVPYPGYQQRPAPRPEPVPQRYNGLNSSLHLSGSSNNNSPGSTSNATFSKSSAPPAQQASASGSSHPTYAPSSSGRQVIIRPRKEVNMFHTKKR
ncbi:RNA polymerase II transcription factor SIII subunit A-domain-containing protein [Peziza echinospora]|nr:RNA polymerase II transcription factor SIII subunit A-domain-containing protein [Peziza echinospora]